MAFNVAALTDYVREIEGDLVSSLVIAPKTAQVIAAEGNIQAGIKSTEKINILDTDAAFQAGGTCGFAASGTTTPWNSRPRWTGWWWRWTRRSRPGRIRTRPASWWQA